MHGARQQIRRSEIHVHYPVPVLQRYFDERARARNPHGVDHPARGAQFLHALRDGLRHLLLVGRFRREFQACGGFLPGHYHGAHRHAAFDEAPHDRRTDAARSACNQRALPVTRSLPTGIHSDLTCLIIASMVSWAAREDPDASVNAANTRW